MKAHSDHDRNDKDYLNNEELAAQCARALRNLSLNRKYTFVRLFVLFLLEVIRLSIDISKHLYYS